MSNVLDLIMLMTRVECRFLQRQYHVRRLDRLVTQDMIIVNLQVCLIEGLPNLVKSMGYIRQVYLINWQGQWLPHMLINDTQLSLNILHESSSPCYSDILAWMCSLHLYSTLIHLVVLNMSCHFKLKCLFSSIDLSPMQSPKFLYLSL